MKFIIGKKFEKKRLYYLKSYKFYSGINEFLIMAKDKLHAKILFCKDAGIQNEIFCEKIIEMGFPKFANAPDVRLDDIDNYGLIGYFDECKKFMLYPYVCSKQN